MFTAKKTKLFDNSKKTTSVSVETVSSPFVKAASKKSNEVRSGNDSLKYKSTGNPFVDQFGTMSTYLSPRSYADVNKDMITLWAINAKLTVCFLFFLRMITRVVSLFDNKKTESVQKGAGLRHEGNLRMLWLYINHSDTFWKNIQLYISVGSWRDIISMLSYDLQYNGWEGRKLDWNKFGQLLLVGLENPAHTQLIKKWLPQIKSNSKCTTLESQADNMIAKWICSLLYGAKQDGSTYKKYRKLKSSGTAHQWQQLISQKKFNDIDFDSIHGKALTLLASSKFLKNHGLEAKYAEWIASKPVAKFTGFVHELVQNITGNMQKYQKDTINAQYQTILENSKVNTSESPYRAIACLDTSGSMSNKVYTGKTYLKISAIQLATSLGILLDDMLPQSPFKGHVLEFSRVARLTPLRGNNFVDKYMTYHRAGILDTNFMGVFDLFIKIKKDNPTLSEEHYPNMIVCFSDGEFNSVGRSMTNVQAGRQILESNGFSKEFSESFGFCFVDIRNKHYGSLSSAKFETFGNVKNVFYFSGYDISPLGFLFGKSKVTERIPTTAEELFNAAMEQEVLQLIEI